MDPIKTELLVVGAAPGGYAAAFYAADLGKKVVLVEQDKRLGGVCLNRGCIPSKALLHATELLAEAKSSVACSSAFEGIHPRLRQTPPRRLSCSTRTTFLPRSAA